MIRRILVILGMYIRRMIDYFYPPFSKFFSKQLFRYGVTGGSNVVFDSILYSVIYNFVLQKQIIDLPLINISLSPHTAALLITFPITLLTGFLLQKYVTFTSSEVKGYYQLARYISVVGINLLINYFGIKLLVEYFNFYPTISKLIATIVCTVISYLSQKHFTFKTKSN